MSWAVENDSGFTRKRGEKGIPSLGVKTRRHQTEKSSQGFLGWSVG